MASEAPNSGRAIPEPRHIDVNTSRPAKAQFKLLDSDFWQQVESTSTYELALVNGSHHFDDAKVYQHMLQDFLLGRDMNTAMDVIKRKKGKKINKRGGPQGMYVKDERLDML